MERSPQPRLENLPSKRLTCTIGPDHLALTYRWFSGSAVGVALMAVVWNGAVAILGVLLAGQPGTDREDLAFFGLAILVGLWIAYAALGLLINRTHVRASRDGVRVRIAPLPWPGSRFVPRERMGPLYVEQQTARRRPRDRRIHQPATSFRVRVVRPDGKRRTLLGGINRADEARFLERRLETYLGLPDTPVDGEVLSL